MKPNTIVVLAGMLSWPGMSIAQEAKPPLTERLRSSAVIIQQQEVELVAVQTAAREANKADEAAVQARFAAQELRLAAMVKQAKEDLAEALALHNYAQKQMRLAKESLGRGLQLVDEASSLRAQAERAKQEAAALEAAARKAEEAARLAAATANAERATDPSVPGYWGDLGYSDNNWHRPGKRCPTPPKPQVTRVPRNSIASEFPSPMRGIPVKR